MLRFYKPKYYEYRMVFIDIVIFALSLVLVLKSSDNLVKSGSTLAKILGVSDFFIGLTVIAVGTSIPEFATSIIASLKNNSQVITGTIFGSNVANIGLILGIAFILMPIKIRKKGFSLETIFLVFISILTFILSLNNYFGFSEGIFFLFLFILFIIYIIKVSKKQEFKKNFNKGNRILVLLKSIIILAISLIVLYFGASYLIKSASKIAIFFKVPEGIIALTLIAVGTSLPELFVTLSCIKNHNTNILLGNIIGSNISNTLLILGASAVLNTVMINTFNIFIVLPIMITVSLLLYIFIKTIWFSRVLQGVFFLFFYSLFILFLIFTSPL